MKNFPEIFRDVERLTADERKPLSAMVSQLFQEGGELAEAASITEGHITHKTLSEPLVGEVADVCQVAISILVRATPELTPQERYNLFLSHFERKNKKWEGVQVNERFDVRNATAIAAAEVERGLDEIDMIDDYSGENVVPSGFIGSLKSKEETERPLTEPIKIDERVFRVIREQLGLHPHDVKMDGNFVDDFGADSLDLVELAMAIEDEFEFEVSDVDAEAITTPRQIITYLRKRYGLGQDPASDYTETTGRYLSLSERMQERSIHSRNHGGTHEEF